MLLPRTLMYHKQKITPSTHTTTSPTPCTPCGAPGHRQGADRSAGTLPLLGPKHDGPLSQQRPVHRPQDHAELSRSGIAVAAAGGSPGMLRSHPRVRLLLIDDDVARGGVEDREDLGRDLRSFVEGEGGARCECHCTPHSLNIYTSSVGFLTEKMSREEPRTINGGSASCMLTTSDRKSAKKAKTRKENPS